MSRSKKQIEQPFGDWPRMEFLDREQVFHITGKYGGPSGWWENGFPILMLVVFAVLTPWSCVSVINDLESRGQNDQAGDVILASFFIALIAFLFTIGIAGYFGTRRRLDVKFSRDAIEIRGKRYARAAPHQFSVEEHEKAFGEEERRQSTRIYRHAMQVVMRYGDRRIAIADFRRKNVRKAEALLVRLQFLDTGFEELLMAAQGSSAAASAEQDDFGPARPIR